MKWKICLMVMLWPFANAFSQSTESPNHKKSLNVGDSIPESLWNRPLSAVNYLSEEATVTLNKFKDKLLILDFGATYCPPCIRSIYKLDSIESQMKDIFKFFPVSGEQKKNVITFLKRSGLDVSFVTDYSALMDLFPYETTPHLIWIWNGTIAAITESYYATAENIQAVIKNEEPDLPVKREWREFKSGSAWSSLGDAALSQSTIAGYIPGGWPISDIDPQGEITLVNLSVQGLYREVISIFNSALRTHNRLLLEMNDTLKRKVILPKEYESDEIKKSQWNNVNTFSYHLKLPPGFSSKELGQIALDELNRFFQETMHITGKIEKRKVKCLALVRTSDRDMLKTRYPDQNDITFDSDGIPIMRNVPFERLASTVAYVLNGLPTPVIDQTGYEGNIDYDLNLERGNVKKARRELQRYGLDLREGVHEINMLVISETEAI